MMASEVVSELQVIKAGHPLLSQRAKEVEEHLFGSVALDNIIESMFLTMKSSGGVGLAAPQVSLDMRLLVFGLGGQSAIRKGIHIPATVMINPVIEFLTDEKEEGYEGCLSVGKLMAKVPRYTKIAVTAYNASGDKIEAELSGLEARIIQHEYDHLDGILFLERVVNSRSFAFYEELKQRGQI